MEKQDEGIVGIISNHSYLDNPTFNGMRQSLLNTFQRIYILDLHGSTQKKELPPDGGKDKNVFDIKQGVAISLYVKKQGLKKGIFKADLWGSRNFKYTECLNNNLDSIEWDEIHPESPDYFFVFRDMALKKEYDKGWKITDIFLVSSVGVVTGNDKTYIGFDNTSLKKQLDDLDKYEDQKVQNIHYRPFDIRMIYYDTKLLERVRATVMWNMIAGDNKALISARSNKSSVMDHFFVSEFMSEAKMGESTVQSSLYPLYLYPPAEKSKKPNKGFFENDPFEGKEKIENFVKEFRDYIDNKYEHHYEPEEILGYIYAVLYSPTYRTKYGDSLKTDYPRIPFADSRKTFEDLSVLGQELIDSHLLSYVPKLQLGQYKSKGNHEVKKIVWANNKLYINEESWFESTPVKVWEFTIGGYPVLDTYLKYRKGRELSLPEIENIEKVIKILAFTIDQMDKIDRITFLQ